jgi:hypothetical protein
MESVARQRFESHALDPVDTARPTNRRFWLYGAVGTCVLFAMGTWLVWFSAYVQRKFAEDDVRAACQRVMPQTADRCVDTVVIQRGGMRR